MQQVCGSLVAAATSVVNEASSTADHARRVSYAQAILSDPLPLAKAIGPGLLTNPTIAAAAGGTAGPSGTPIIDSDLDFVVSSLFDIYADFFVATTNNAPTPVFPSPS